MAGEYDDSGLGGLLGGDLQGQQAMLAGLGAGMPLDPETQRRLLLQAYLPAVGSHLGASLLAAAQGGLTPQQRAHYIAQAGQAPVAGAEALNQATMVASQQQQNVLRNAITMDTLRRNRRTEAREAAIQQFILGGGQGGGAGGAAGAGTGASRPATGGGGGYTGPGPSPEIAAMIAEASRETGVPAEILTAVFGRESGWDNSRRGTSGEIGIAQIMPATARQPGYGVQPIDIATLSDPRAGIMFGARYLAGKARALGVTDWTDPAQVDRALAAYNGGGDPNYVQNVRAFLPGGARAAAPGGGGTPAAASGGAPASEYRKREDTRDVLATLTPQQRAIIAAMPPAQAAQAIAQAQLQANARDPTYQPLSEQQLAGLGVPAQSARIIAGLATRQQQDEALRALSSRETKPSSEQEDALRTQFQALPQADRLQRAAPLYESVTGALDRVRASRRPGARPDPLAAYDAVVGYANLLDPTSVVREGEVANVLRSQGVPNYIIAQVERVMGGQPMSDELATMIENSVNDRMGSYRRAYDTVGAQYRALATRRGLSHENVVLEYADPVAARAERLREGGASTPQTPTPPANATPAEIARQIRSRAPGAANLAIRQQAARAAGIDPELVR